MLKINYIQFPVVQYLVYQQILKPFLKTKLISPLGKLRAGKDLIKPSLNIDNDISVGQFFRERLGDEILENLIEPLMGGIYGTDIDDLSLMSTFPEFKQREEPIW
ncbi:protoporphyrinogen oxidase [Staphylococcus gallinarum]|uniref:Protoporphyrinogen oxidase n=1 Tax=Staphylococcus gallinarum TaxID=1293 RepID=A0A380FK44_STAGA|nr:protoporphyrinogen oxidase [Staphylococcus gallinarum]